MKYIVVYICETCKGIIDGDSLILESEEFTCRCDAWGDTDPDNSGAAGPEQHES